MKIRMLALLAALALLAGCAPPEGETTGTPSTEEQQAQAAGQPSEQEVLSQADRDQQEQPAATEEGADASGVGQEQQEAEEIPLTADKSLLLTYAPRTDRTLVTSVQVKSGGGTETLYDGYAATTPVINQDHSAFAFIHDFDFEVIGQVLLYDGVQQTVWDVAFQQLPADWSPSALLWLDNETLLAVCRYGYGTITQGGDVYYYPTGAPHAKTLFTVQGRTQITGFHLEGDTLVLEAVEYLDDNYLDYDRFERAYSLEEVRGAMEQELVLLVARE